MDAKTPYSSQEPAGLQPVYVPIGLRSPTRFAIRVQPIDARACLTRPEQLAGLPQHGPPDERQRERSQRQKRIVESLERV